MTKGNGTEEPTAASPQAEETKPYRERSAAELLVAQLEYEVAECKVAIIRALRFDGISPDDADREFVNAIESLVGKVVMRWWIARGIKAIEPVSDAEFQQRHTQRMLAIASACEIVKNRTGEMTNDALQMQMAGIASEMQGIWACLIQCGLTSEHGRQDYLDHGAASLFQRIQDFASKIIPADASGRIKFP